MHLLAEFGHVQTGPPDVRLLDKDEAGQNAHPDMGIYHFGFVTQVTRRRRLIRFLSSSMMLSFCSF
jgi:hypothetical protein